MSQNPQCSNMLLAARLFAGAKLGQEEAAMAVRLD